MDNLMFPDCLQGSSCYDGHAGVDYYMESGTPIIAPANGYVIWSAFSPGADPCPGGISPNGDTGMIILAHPGTDYFSCYLHLEPPLNVSVGESVETGDTLGFAGNTGCAQSPHLHFEINLLANESFPTWYKNRFPGQRNDHGKWNGQNLIGLNPWDIFVSQKEAAFSQRKFSMVQYIQAQPVLCRIKVIKPGNFNLLKRFPLLVTGNNRGQLAGYEVSLNPNGVPVRIITIATDQLGAKESTEVVVDPQVYKAAPCRKLVFKKGQKWVLTAKGMTHLDLITK